MAIRVDCSGCGASFQIGDESAGKRGKCPKCKGGLVVPNLPLTPAAPARVEPEPDDGYALADVQTQARVRGVAARHTVAQTVAASPLSKVVEPTRPTQTPLEILAAFRGEIRPVSPTLLYRLWIVIVAAVMLLLPAVYMGIIAATGVALGLYAMQLPAIIVKFHRFRGATLIVLAPLLAGLVVIAFLLKPLLARPNQRAKARVLDPSKEPLVFAFVDGVCGSVGAPRPSRIEVDCQMNASAHIASGALSLFGRELVLTIGLPLAAGLDLKQFAGVLAHEFGHFSQGAGMRLSFLIRSINAWFYRVIYERDEWDQTLSGWAEEENTYLLVIVPVARLAVWLARRVLWILMMLGHLVSMVLLRQMEFDADRYQARMVGGETVAATMKRITQLSFAEHAAQSELATSWQERRLPDNLPKLILAKLVQIPEGLSEVLEKAESSRAGLFDTHPSNRDRIARARAEAQQGLFRLEGPATDLFKDFDVLARAVTYSHYRVMLGREISKDQLYPVADAIIGQAVAQQEGEAFDRYFLSAFSLMQSLPLRSDYPLPTKDLKGAKAQLAEARADMEVARDENLGALRRSSEPLQHYVNAEAAALIVKAGGRFRAAEFGLESSAHTSPESTSRDAELALKQVDDAMVPFEDAAARRLRLALTFLESEAAIARLADGVAKRNEARALYPCAALLGDRVVRELGPVYRAHQVLGRLIQKYQQGKYSDNDPVVNAIRRGSQCLYDRLQELKPKLGSTVLYPFEHASEDISIAKFALPVIPEREAVTDLLSASAEVIDRLTTLYRRLLGRLATIAEEVERTLGMKPIVLDAAEQKGQG